MSVSSFDLHGQVALVTGSTRGLGRSMALALGRAGARVCLNYAHSRQNGERTLEALRAEGGEGILVQADATTEDGVERLITSCEHELGPVNILVVNATSDQPHRPIEEYDWEFYEEMLRFFVKSPYLLTRRVLPHMKEARFGRIINIGSEVLQRGVPQFSAYVAAKGAQNGWSRSMATELAPWNITVNMISPGWIPVERHENDPAEEKDAYRALIPMNRWGVPTDVDGAVVFLASHAAGFVTGQNLCVNGGMTVA